MPLFKILPTDQTYSAVEIEAIDASAALNVVSQIECKEADVFENDSYAFSVRLDRNGLWSIFQRHENAEANIQILQ